MSSGQQEYMGSVLKLMPSSEIGSTHLFYNVQRDALTLIRPGELPIEILNASKELKVQVNERMTLGIKRQTPHEIPKRRNP